MTGPDISLQAATSSPDLACGVCGSALGSAVKRCPACDTPHHFDCWEFAEGCSVYGCDHRLREATSPAASHALVVDEEAPAPHPLAVQLRTLGRRVAGSLAHAPEWLWKTLGAFLLIGSPLPGLVAVMYILGHAGELVSFALIFLLVLYGWLLILLVSGGMPAFLQDLAQSLAPRELSVKDTRKHLEARLSESPRNAYLLEALGMELLRLGEVDEAARIFDRALLARPGNQQAAFYKARALLEAKRTAEARSVLRQAAHMKPESRLAIRAEKLLQKLGP